MAENLNRQRVLNFLEAFYSGDIEGALARCSDDVEFLTHAPIDILPHLGHRRGKAEVALGIKLVRRLLRRVRRGRQRQQQAGGGGEYCNAVHVRSPLIGGALQTALLGGG